jgi:nucleoside-diphosphate-sugar epimerase
MSRAGLGTLLVFGCGYVGARVAARAAATGAGLAVVTRDPARAAGLRAQLAADALVGDFHDTARVLAFCRGLPAPLRVLCLLPPGACADSADSLAPLERLVEALRALGPLSATLSSSTGVYGEAGSRIVSAESTCLPSTPRERRLHAVEQCWLTLPGARVVRLAGLYGPGRVIGLQGLRAGTPVPGEPDGWLNLLHVDDAARLLLRVAEGGGARIELGADGTPVTRRAYYHGVAALAGVAPPRFSGEAGARGGGSRRCDPSSTWARLDWRPMYRDFRAGLAALPSPLPRV